ncbi:MAG: DUF2058 domain-containing protein [Pseudomonadota bacterium]
MANSFQEQLLKARLVDGHKVKKANHEKHKQKKQHAEPKGAAAQKTQVQQAMAEKAERDRGLNRQKVEMENKKAIAAQIKQLVDVYAVAKGQGDCAYNFEDDGKVKCVYVTDVQRGELARGVLVIVKQDDAYAIVPRPVADKIASRDASRVLRSKDAGQNAAEDDAYANYKIPDDMMW